MKKRTASEKNQKELTASTTQLEIWTPYQSVKQSRIRAFKDVNKAAHIGLSHSRNIQFSSRRINTGL
jgi:hypothetical protein